MRTEKLLSLPVPQSGCGDIRMVATANEMVVEYEYRLHNRDQVGVIEFGGVVSFRFHDEIHAHGFLTESYDTLIRLPDSDWIRTMGSAPGDAEPTLNHFAVFFSSNGYLEVLAETWSDCPSRDGMLEALE